jgi:hypothetical protein
MVKRHRHTDKGIEAAIQYAEDIGWRYHPTGRSAHAWGVLLCPLPSRHGCRLFIWSTPKNTADHASQIARAVAKCEHTIKEMVYA